jgi:hypothetical protein
LEINEVKHTRNINDKTTKMLWAVSAGMCEFRGCKNRLFSHHVTKENINLAQRAHIYAFSKGGKRFSRLVPRAKINDIDNLMLVCGSCHDLIDSPDTNYSAEGLQEMKREHEERIRILTSIKSDFQSEIVIYNCNIADTQFRIKNFDAMECITPDYYPARIEPINLSPDIKLYDYENEYWSIVSTDLERRFELYESAIRGKHISLFAIAPQPLLFKIGTLLNRNYDVAVRQPQGDIATWRWTETSQTINLYTQESSYGKSNQKAAITFEITAQLSDNEITSILPGHNVYRIIAREYNPAIIKSKEDLHAIMRKYREVLNKVRKECAQNVQIALILIAPVSVSIEAGRQLMKGDPTITVYDRCYDSKEWIPTLTFNY